MLTNKKISIIVICYRDAGCIREMHRQVTEIMRQITPNYELIYVNDQSPDNAMEILRELAAHDKRLVVLSHSRNFGGQIAYSTGLTYCTGDAAILLDGDIQDPPSLFVDFVKKWLEGYDVVYGDRVRRKGSQLWNYFYKKFYRLFQKMAYIKVPLDAGDFGLVDRKVIDAINSMPERERHIRGLRAWVGYKNIGIPYLRLEPWDGRKSNNSFFWSAMYAKKVILTFSFKPLEWISYIAGIVTIISMLAILTYFTMYFFFPAPRGFLTLLVSILFLGSVQLLSLSVIAEYLAKIFEEVKRRPKGIVGEVINYHGSKALNQVVD
ncbi:MAG: glycosyltransferase family 2 protein [bacterium]|nr:glycosyltransferase family 2 protein [bacterium]